MKQDDAIADRAVTEPALLPPSLRVPWLRCGIGGMLMGLANLVPGVSGGSMILIVGLYDEFISAVADLTRFKFTLRSILLLGVIGGVAMLAIVTLAGALGRLVAAQQVAMYALFIGMTLGGAPLLWKMSAPLKQSTAWAMLFGLALMLAISFLPSKSAEITKEQKAALKEKAKRGEIEITVSYPLDIVVGVLGMSAMVLPGVSGAYMLVLLGRYETILGSIDAVKKYCLSLGKEGDPSAWHVIIPVAIGSIIGIVFVTNGLKWLLRHYEKQTVAVLLGILLGSAVVLIRRVEPQTAGDYGLAAAMLIGGFIATIGIGRIGNTR